MAISLRDGIITQQLNVFLTDMHADYEKLIFFALWCTFLLSSSHASKIWDYLIVDLFSALLRIQFEGGAKDFSNKRVPHFSR